MAILITGGSGFIGTNLCQALDCAGESFRILDRHMSKAFPEKVDLIDIMEQERLAQSMSGDTIIHLAAEHKDNVRPISNYEQINVEGTRNVCRAASMRGINRIIFTSSVAVYGFAKPGTGEEGEIKPFNEYGRTKYAAEKVLQVWAAEDPVNRSLTIVRPTVVFGPGNRGNVHNLFSQIASGRFIMVGDGENRKSMAYIDNIVAFLRHVVKADPGVHVYNYVDQPEQTMNELVSQVRATVLGKSSIGPRIPYRLGLMLGYLADSLAKVSGKTLPVSAIRVRKFASNTSFASRAHEVAGFSAPVPLDVGIERTLIAEFINPQPDRHIY